MAGDEVKRKKTRRKKHGDTATSKSRKRSEDDSPSARSVTSTARPADVDELRKARLAYLAKSAEDRGKTMKYEYVKRTRTVSLVDGEQEERHKAARHRAPERTEPRPSRRHTRRAEGSRRQAHREESEDEYVYSKADREPNRSEAHSKTPRQPTRTVESSQRKAEERRRVPERRYTEPARRGNPRNTEDEPPRRIVDDRRSPRRRSTVSVDKAPRPPIERSATTTAATIKEKTEVHISKPSKATESLKKTPGLFSGLLAPKAQLPKKKVSCLTCGADDIPINESAKLQCTHRMCHACLKRIFSMSVTDPAHMPPRCCTDAHIPLEHVAKLFDEKFKVLWNRKFQEYKTKNRIYCTNRKCGIWIKPKYITTDNGRKVGKCKACKTRVCAICSQKMHTARDCPKDPETKKFVEVAKEQGWQRCYSCSAMVELKEGCNHMTCRCTAEFCMVCGLKWKSCDCPWFNYEAVDAHLGDPIRQQQEQDRRRDQMHRDEVLARRMQQLGLGFGLGNEDDDRDRQNDFGLGNAANHHMNQNFIQQAREALTANYAQAEQAARGLLNGFVMGRENRLPGFPMEMDQMLWELGPGDPAEQDQPRRPGRRNAARRRSALPDGPGEHRNARERDEEQRIHDWANGVAT